MSLDELLEQRKQLQEVASRAWKEVEAVNHRIATQEKTDALEWFKAAASQALDGFSIYDEFLINGRNRGYGLYFRSSVAPVFTRYTVVRVPLTLSYAEFEVYSLNETPDPNSTHPWLYRVRPGINPVELGPWFRANILKYKQNWPAIASFGQFCQGLCHE